jgi:hypothetical protein
MVALKINVSDSVHARLKTQAKKNGFRNVKEYVETILVVDTAGPQMNDEELEELLLSRIEGPTVPMDARDFQQIRKKLRDRIRRRT